MRLSLPESYKNYDALYLRAFDPAGKEISCLSWKTNGNTNQVPGLVEKTLSAEEERNSKH